MAHSPPFAFVAFRCVGGALALLFVLKLTGRSLKLVAPGPTLAIGLTQVTGFMMFQTWALVEGGLGKTAVLIFTMPIWTLLMAWPILGERIRGKQWLAAASTLGGLLLIIEPWNMIPASSANSSAWPLHCAGGYGFTFLTGCPLGRPVCQCSARRWSRSSPLA